MMLISVAAFSVMTTGCSDSDDGGAGGGNEASGMGGQTYTAAASIAGTNMTLVVVTRDGGAPSPASTGGMMAAASVGGSADGLLLVGDSVRQILVGTYDPDLVEDPTLSLSHAGGVTFEGTATRTFFTGTLTVPGIGSADDVGGFGGQEDAPLIHLLGTWQHDNTIRVSCGTAGSVTFECAGVTRIRSLGGQLRMDSYESCDQAPFECELGDSLSDGSWSGGTYTENASERDELQGCLVDLVATLSMTVDSLSLSSTTEGTITLANSLCGPAGTQCAIEQVVAASRCIDCWPAGCTESGTGVVRSGVLPGRVRRATEGLLAGRRQ